MKKATPYVIILSACAFFFLIFVITKKDWFDISSHLLGSIK